mmetsp:Transcript_14016/g.20358  ORF Transcript_14016/g.20358 Transcript_14016/m.20358 type:complete len:229 (+) Transcript_14016:1630-2316(+)
MDTPSESIRISTSNTLWISGSASCGVSLFDSTIKVSVFISDSSDTKSVASSSTAALRAPALVNGERGDVTVFLPSNSSQPMTTTGDVGESGRSRFFRAADATPGEGRGRTPDGESENVTTFVGPSREMLMYSDVGGMVSNVCLRLATSSIPISNDSDCISSDVPGSLTTLTFSARRRGVTNGSSHEYREELPGAISQSRLFEDTWANATDLYLHKLTIRNGGCSRSSE